LREKPLPGQHSFERNEDVPVEALHPAILDGAEPVRIGCLCLKIPKQAWIDPAEIHVLLSLQSHTSNRHRATDRLPPEAALLDCRIVDALSRASPLRRVTYATNNRSRSGEHFQPRSWF